MPSVLPLNLSTRAWEMQENRSFADSTINNVRWCPSCYGTERATAIVRLRALFLAQNWSRTELQTLHAVKLALIGHASPAPLRNMDGDSRAVCMWDCYRRATMLEPLASDVLRNDVPGDFVEAGVFRGGIAIHMAAILAVAGTLGNGPSRRRVWLCDSFRGMPERSNYSSEWAAQRRATGRTTAQAEALIARDVDARGLTRGQFAASFDEVRANVREHLSSVLAPDAAAARTTSHLEGQGGEHGRQQRAGGGGDNGGDSASSSIGSAGDGDGGGGRDMRSRGAVRHASSHRGRGGGGGSVGGGGGGGGGGDAGGDSASSSIGSAGDGDGGGGRDMRSRGAVRHASSHPRAAAGLAPGGGAPSLGACDLRVQSLAACGVHLLPGFFATSLPGPIRGAIALLRIDADLYSSIYECLTALYPRLSVGGWVVFDDFKINQARAAILDFRAEHRISSQVMSSNRYDWPKVVVGEGAFHRYPFATLDRVAFWQKSRERG